MVRKLGLELLESREVPTTALFLNGALKVFGDSFDNSIVVSAQNGVVNVLDNGNVVPVVGGPVQLSQLMSVYIDGAKGNDSIVTDSSLNTLTNGSLSFSPSSTLLGGKGNDFLKVGHGGIVGGLAGVRNGVVVGTVVGNSVMDGGDGNDALVSGFGNDKMRGGNGNDSYLWPPGTLTDTWDGGSGYDIATVIGNDGANDQFVLSANGTNVLFQRTNIIQFAVDMKGTEQVVLNPGTGDDVVTITNLVGVSSLTSVVVNGGGGNDVLDGFFQQSKRVALSLNGGDGDDVLKGGKFLSGNLGADVFVARPNALVLDYNVNEGDILLFV